MFRKLEGYSQVEGSQEEILSRSISWENVMTAADPDTVLHNDEYPSLCSYSDDNHDVDDNDDDDNTDDDIECMETVGSENDEDSGIMEDEILETLEAILNGDIFSYDDDTSVVSTDPAQYCEYVIDFIISDAVDISESFGSNQCEIKYENYETTDDEESDSQITTELSEDRIFDDSFGESIDDDDDNDEYLEEQSTHCIKEENGQNESSFFLWN
jgi:hypothetical protein